MIKEFYIDCCIDEIIENENMEVVECVDGCLIDNLLVFNQGMTVVFYEKYVNCWTSRYLVKQATTQDDSYILENEFYNIFNI